MEWATLQDPRTGLAASFQRSLTPGASTTKSPRMVWSLAPTMREKSSLTCGLIYLSIKKREHMMNEQRPRAGSEAIKPLCIVGRVAASRPFRRGRQPRIEPQTLTAGCRACSGPRCKTCAHVSKLVLGLAASFQRSLTPGASTKKWPRMVWSQLNSAISSWKRTFCMI